MGLDNPLAIIKEKKTFQIGEDAVVTLLVALGELPHSKVDGIIKFLKANLIEVSLNEKQSNQNNTVT